MEAHVLTTVDQVQQWIELQRLERWTISADKADSTNQQQKVIAMTMKDQSMEDRIEYTKKALSMFPGMKLYARGFREGTTICPCYAEICIGGAEKEQNTALDQIKQMIGTTMMAPAAKPIDEEALAERIRKEVRYEYQEQELERQRKDFEAERKEFNEQKDGVMGLLVHYLAPVAQQLAQNLTGGRTHITGVETAGGEVEADAIRPTVATPVADPVAQPAEAEAEEEADSIFSDEEAEQIETLLARLKAAEPRYLEMLQRVVEMAEAGDTTYQMAKGFLLKD